MAKQSVYGETPAEAISGTLAVSSNHLSYTALPDLAKVDDYYLLYNAIQLASLVWHHAYTTSDNTPARNRVWPRETYNIAN